MTEPLKLWKIEQSVNRDWDTYDSAIVAAPDAETARRTHPSTTLPPVWDDATKSWNDGGIRDWAPIDQVEVTLIGIAAEGVSAGVIVASYNAG